MDPLTYLGAPESEQAVLGALVLEPEIRALTLESLRPGCFASEANRTIYDAIVKLYLTGKDFDLLQVQSELRSSGRLEAIGGTDYLWRIARECPIPLDGPRYAENVVAASSKRRLSAALKEAQENLTSGDLDGPRLLSRIVSAISDARVGSLMAPMSELIVEAMDAQLKANEGGAPQTLIPRLDTGLNLFVPGELTVVAARPGGGKSTFMRQVVAAAARDVKVLLFSLEVAAPVLTAQILCEVAGVPYDLWRKGQATTEQQALIAVYMGQPWLQNIWISKAAGISALDVSIALTQQLAAGPVGLVAIDYLGLMKHSKAERNDLRIADTTYTLKQLALGRQVPIMLLAQLNREVEKRGGSGEGDRPRLSDLRDSGSIEQDADNILFLWRKERDAAYSVVEERVLTVAKHRNGAVFELDLLFNKELGRFSEQTYGRDGRAAASGEGS